MEKVCFEQIIYRLQISFSASAEIRSFDCTGWSLNGCNTATGGANTASSTVQVREIKVRIVFLENNFMKVFHRLSPKAMSLQQMKPQVRECGASMLSMVRNTAARRI